MTASVAAARLRASSSSSRRQAAAGPTVQPGMPVIEFDASSTTDALPAAASCGCRPRTSAIAPKKLTDISSAGSTPVMPAIPAAGTTPCTTSVSACTAATAAARPSGVARSASTSASCRSTVITRWPCSRRRAVVAAPMPLAAPETTYVLVMDAD